MQPVKYAAHEMLKPLAAYIASRAFNAYRKNMHEILVGFYFTVMKIGF